MEAADQGCWECGYRTAEALPVCPECGKRMQTLRGIRRTGWVLIGAGGALLALLTGIIVLTAQIIAHSDDPGATTRFDGDAGDATVVFALLGLVWVFGLISVGNGAWMLRYGRRNRRLMKGLLWLWAVFLAVGTVVQLLD